MADNTGIDVSVVITTYNVERYIARAVSSVLTQEGVTFEILIVDDCSTDNTWVVINDMTDPRIKCMQLPTNSGPSAARNAAIEEAKGTWIAVLDGDDAYEPGRLERCIKFAQARNADIVVDNIRICREADDAEYNMFPASVFYKLSVLTLASFIDGNKSFFGGYTLGYLKPIFSAAFLSKNKLAYDPAIRIGEDYMLMAESLACGALCVTEQSAGYRYTVRSSSISYRLTTAAIKRIASLDLQFTSRYRLDSEAEKAQKKRESSLKEIYAFTLLAESLKKRDVVGAFKAIIACPIAIRQIWRPFYVRASRGMKLLTSKYT